MHFVSFGSLQIIYCLREQTPQAKDNEAKDNPLLSPGNDHTAGLDGTLQWGEERSQEQFDTGVQNQ